MIEKTLPKIGIVTILVMVSSIGFMVKLPRAFSHCDKELHFLFYFGAAVVLNYLFVKKNFLHHLVVGWILFCAGIFIEIAQELSNLFVEKRIHGNFDPEDISSNMFGLIFYSFIWAIWRILLLIK
tara:strand:+ start:757 stop:1131 length:375 start_codon:yes stop_codon:yes gene_type:complete